LRKAEAIFCQGIDVGRLNLRAETADVGKSEVVGKDNQDIGFRCGSGCVQREGQEEEQG
jgi:hypothetical protein